MTEPSPDQQQRVLPARLREAREFLGLSAVDVAEAVGVHTETLTVWEAGGGKISGEQLRRLMRIYRRPLDWLCGTEVPHQPSPGLLAMLDRAEVTDDDREVILAFDEFLAGAGPAPARSGGNRDGRHAR